MSDTQPVTILFTANLRANLAQMPYVATTLRRARHRSASEEPLPTLVLDVGGAWAADAWVCQVTGNRAPYLILDAMGYHVARADGLDVGGILGLREVVSLFLMDDSIVYTWRMQGVTLNVGPKAEPPAVTWPVPLAPAEGGELLDAEAGRLTLYPPDGYVGKAVVEWPSMTVIEAQRVPFATDRPDPSIIETVKFVEYEARAYHRRQQEGDE